VAVEAAAAAAAAAVAAAAVSGPAMDNDATFRAARVHSGFLAAYKWVQPAVLQCCGRCLCRPRQ